MSDYLYSAFSDLEKAYKAGLAAAPASPAASVLSDEQRTSVELALKAMNVAMSVYDVVMVDKARAGLRALLAASMGGDRK